MNLTNIKNYPYFFHALKKRKYDTLKATKKGEKIDRLQYRMDLLFLHLEFHVILIIL